MGLNEKTKASKKNLDSNWFLSMFDYSEKKKGFLATRQKPNKKNKSWNKQRNNFKKKLQWRQK